MSTLRSGYVLGSNKPIKQKQKANQYLRKQAGFQKYKFETRTGYRKSLFGQRHKRTTISGRIKD